MKTKEIKEKLVNLLIATFPNVSLNKDALDYVNLIDDLGMDSITFVSIVVEIEKIFDIIIPDEILVVETFNSLNNIVYIVEDLSNITGDEYE